MNEAEQQPITDIKVDEHNLYREENFTDLKVASIRRLLPIKADGSPDDTRLPIYVGSTHIMSQMGPVPVQSQIEASSLTEAIQKFPDAIAQAIEEMIEEAKERRRESSSRIVVPGAMPGGGLTGQGGIPGAGAPGGSIQLG